MDETARQRQEAALRWAAMEADSTRDERAAVKDQSIGERLKEVIGLWALTVAELSRRCETEAELVKLLQGDPPFDLTAHWRANQSK